MSNALAKMQFIQPTGLGWMYMIGWSGAVLAGLTSFWESLSPRGSPSKARSLGLMSIAAGLFALGGWYWISPLSISDSTIAWLPAVGLGALSFLIQKLGSQK